MSAKQKVLHGHGGPSNLNLGIFVCSFDVCGLPNHSSLLTTRKHNQYEAQYLPKRAHLMYDVNHELGAQ